MHGVQGDAHVVACALVEASLPYPLEVACVLGTASLLYQVKTLVACVSGVTLDVYHPKWLNFVQGKPILANGVQGDAHAVVCPQVEASLPYPREVVCVEGMASPHDQVG